MSSTPDNLASRTHSATRSNDIAVINPEDADLVIRLEQGHNTLPIILRASSAKVIEHFRSLTISQTHTDESPLVLHSLHGAALILLMKLAHGIEVRSEEVSGEDFRWMAELVLEYNYHGTSPPWLAERVAELLPNDFAPFPQIEGSELLAVYGLDEFDERDDGEAGEAYMISPIFQCLCLSLAFELPELFARSSRQLTWVLRPLDFHPTSTNTTRDKLIVQLYDAHISLRNTLFAKLPPILHPDPHGKGPGDCRQCNAVPHLERWYEELWHSDFYWVDAIPLPNNTYDLTCGSLYSTFKALFETMLHDFERDDDVVNQLPCGRFRVRVDELPEVNEEELLMNVYDDIGGWCLECFKSGICHFKSKCQQHGLSLRPGYESDGEPEYDGVGAESDHEMRGV